MPPALGTIEEILRNVETVLAMQQRQIDDLREQLAAATASSAAKAAAAETVCRQLPDCGDGCGCNIQSGSRAAGGWGNPPSIEQLRKAAAEQQKQSAEQAVSACKAGLPAWATVSAPAYDIAAGERAAYLRGFEAAKQLLLAVKPEPAAGPDNFLWVNVYKDPTDGSFSSGEGWETKRAADKNAASNRIARVRLWFNEGQYDD